jgi:RNA polymerase sigma-70 factor (ECF subfamily)
MNLPDDSELLNLLQKDDPKAFETLFRMYHKRIYGFALHLLNSSSQAEDIVQNVFMAIWNQRKTLQISTSFITYLFGITRHMVCEYIQRKINHEAFVEFSLENNTEYSFITEDEILYNELQEQLKKYIEELPVRRREIFLLHRLNGFSYKEIANKLNISENTVDTQIRHSLNYLKAKILNGL